MKCGDEPAGEVYCLPPTPGELWAEEAGGECCGTWEGLKPRRAILGVGTFRVSKFSCESWGIKVQGDGRVWGFFKV